MTEELLDRRCYHHSDCMREGVDNLYCRPNDPRYLKGKCKPKIALGSECAWSNLITRDGDFYTRSGLVSDTAKWGSLSMQPDVKRANYNIVSMEKQCTPLPPNSPGRAVCKNTVCSIIDLPLGSTCEVGKYCLDGNECSEGICVSPPPSPPPPPQNLTWVWVLISIAGVIGIAWIGDYFWEKRMNRRMNRSRNNANSNVNSSNRSSNNANANGGKRKLKRKHTRTQYLNK